MADPESRHRFWILLACGTTLFLAALDQTIMAPALPAIATEFGNWQDVSWVVTAYLLVATAVIPIYGRASDVYGRRPAMTVAIGTFCVGSLMCALSTDMLQLALARGVQALGGGGLISLAMTVVGDLLAPRERGKYQGYISGIYASAAVLGPSLGGMFSEQLHWSVIFWINIPIGAVALIIVWMRMGDLGRGTSERTIDLPGALLFASGIALVVFVISSGGVRWAWTSYELMMFAAAAMVLLALFAVWVAKVEDALIARHVVANRIVVMAVISALLAVGTLVALSTFAPIFFQVSLGLSASEAGFALVPMMVGIVIGATLSGKSLTRIDNYKLIPLLGLAFGTVVTLCLSFTVESLPPAMLSAALAAVSLGIGSMMPISLIIVQNAAERSDMGAATALMNLCRQLGAVLFVALYSALLFGTNRVMDGAATVPLGAGDGFASRFSVVLGMSALTLALAWVLFGCIEPRQLRSHK